MSKTAFIIRLRTESGGTLSTDCVTAEDDITLAELVKRCDFGGTPASGGDILTIEKEEPPINRSDRGTITSQGNRIVCTLHGDITGQISPCSCWHRPPPCQGKDWGTHLYEHYTGRQVNPTKPCPDPEKIEEDSK